jgi:pilus assembly protein CpaB
MDVRRLSLAVLIALVLSGGATYLLYAHLRNQKAAVPATIHVIAATGELQAGTALSAGNVRVMDWPANAPLINAFTKSDQVLGRTLLYPVSANQPVLETDLAAPGSGLGLSAKIPEGMRAISVRSNDVIGVAGFLYPGSHVDVMLTYKPDTTPAPVTETILQDVTVLTAGQTLEPDPKGKPETVNVVTLLLSPRDAQKMELATEQGTVQFVLRNGADQNEAATRPVLVSQLGNDVPPEPPKPHLAGVRLKPVVRPPEFYTVETIAGDKHTVEKF